MDTVDGRAAECTGVLQVDVVVAQPLNALGGVLGQHLDQLGVVDALAADHGIQLHQLHGVEVAFGVLLVGSPLNLDFVSQLGDGLVVSVSADTSQGLLHAGSLSEGGVVLVGGVAGVHAAGSTDGVAAHASLGLQDDDLRALLGSGQSRGHASAAGADDHDVSFQHGVLSLHGLGLGHVVLGVQASGDQGSLGSLDHAVGGEGSASDDVHIHGVAGDHRGRQLLQSRGAHAGGLVSALGLGSGNHAVFDGQGHSHIAAKALGGAGHFVGHGGNHGQHHDQSDQHCSKTLHVQDSS